MNKDVKYKDDDKYKSDDDGEQDNEDSSEECKNCNKEDNEGTVDEKEFKKDRIDDSSGDDGEVSISINDSSYSGKSTLDNDADDDEECDNSSQKNMTFVSVLPENAIVLFSKNTKGFGTPTWEYRQIRNKLSRSRNRKIRNLDRDIYNELKVVLKVPELFFYVEQVQGHNFKYRRLSGVEMDEAVLEDIITSAKNEYERIKNRDARQNASGKNQVRKTKTTKMSADINERSGIEPNNDGHDDKELFVSAVIDGNIQLMQKIMQSRENDAIFTDSLLVKALHVSCHHGNLKMVQYILQQGEQQQNHRLVFESDNEGRTASHYACYGGGVSPPHRQLQIVTFLLEFCNPARIVDDPRDNLGRSAFHFACASGRIDIVQHFAKDINVEICDYYGHTSLHYACNSKHYAIVKYLIEKEQANLEATDRFGRGPLHCTIYGDGCMQQCTIPGCDLKHVSKYGRYDVAKYLIQTACIDIEAITNNGSTPLHYACGGNTSDEYSANVLPGVGSSRQCLLSIVKLLIGNNANVKVADGLAMTPLHYACQNGSYQIVEHLVEHGADVHALDSHRMTPLHYSCQNGYYEVVDYLIRLGEANVDAVANGGMTALHMACDKGHQSIVNCLLLRGNATVIMSTTSGITPLHCACKYGHFGVVTSLVTIGKDDARTRSSEGMTALHYAAMKKNSAIVEFLITNTTANITSDKMSGGRTALHIACEHNCFSSVQCMVRLGRADVNEETNTGMTALHYACIGGYFAIVKYLIKECGALYKTYEGSGRNALFFACENGHAKVVQFLLDECEIDVCATAFLNGWTALHYAVKSGHLNIVRYLTQKDRGSAHLSKKHLETGTITPYRLAMDCGHQTVADYLLQQVSKTKNL